MNFHPDDFVALVAEVEGQGGAHLSGEICTPTVLGMNLPIDWNRPSGPKHHEKVPTTGCRRRAKFLVPLLPEAYFDQHDLTAGAVHGSVDPDDPGKMVRRPAEDSDFDFNDEKNKQATMGDGTPMLAKVCAVDDAMGLWPRYKDALYTGESYQEY